MVTVIDATPLLPSLDAVIVTGPPTDTPVTSPEFETPAIAGLLDSHVTTRPDSVLLFASRGVAVSCALAPTATDELAGVTPTVATATETVTEAFPLIPSLVATIVTGPPGATPVTTPDVDTLTIDGLLDVHEMVRPVSGFPLASRGVAVSCTVDPTASVDAAGATTTDATGTITLTDAVPLLPSLVAVMVTVDPTATPVTTPLAETVATAGLLDDQLVVRPLIALPLASRGVAVNCADAPGATLTAAGVTVTLAIAASTLMVAVPDFPSLDAVIVIGPPAEIVVTKPPEVTTATAVLDELQVIVRPLSDCPRLSSSDAANCWDSPTMSEALAGDNAIDATGACFGPELSPPLQAVKKPSHETTAIDRKSLRVICPTLAKHL